MRIVAIDVGLRVGLGITSFDLLEGAGTLAVRNHHHQRILELAKPSKYALGHRHSVVQEDGVFSVARNSHNFLVESEEVDLAVALVLRLDRVHRAYQLPQPSVAHRSSFKSS